MRLKGLLWVRIPILKLFYAPEEIRFGYHIGYFLLKSRRKLCKALILLILILGHAGLSLRQTQKTPLSGVFLGLGYAIQTNSNNR